MQKAFDLIVIGAGSAGFSAAITGAEQDASVVLIGHGVIGGTCTNVGCIPSKTLIRAAGAIHSAQTASRFSGLAPTRLLRDWRALIAQKNALVAELRQARYVDLLPSYQRISYVSAPARLVEGGVEAGGDLFSAPNIIIATGARPAIPPIDGLADVPYLTSTTALDLEILPPSLLVIGGGYIGAEMAQLFARAGVRVTLACRSRLLAHAEPELSAALTRFFEMEGIGVEGGLSYRSVSRTRQGIRLQADRDGQPVILEADQVLVATGRTANIEALGLTHAGIALDRAGRIVVDDYLRTARPGVYAAGDVTDRDQFVYMAAYGAKLAALNALRGDQHRYRNEAMPQIMFTDPQLASVGLTEAKARAAGYAVRVSFVDLDYVPRAQVSHDTRGAIKLIADGATRRILGASVLAPEGADSIQTAVLAVKLGLTIDDLVDTLFPYLTTVEGLRLAAQAFDRDLDKLSCCAG